MTSHEDHVAHADGSRGVHIYRPLERQCRASHEPGENRDAEYGNRPDYILDARTQDCHDPDGEQDAWKGKEDIADSHDDTVDPAFIEPTQQPHYDTDNAAYGNCQETDHQGDTGSVNDAAENVPSIIIRPGPMQPGRSLENMVVIRSGRIVWGNPGCQKRNENQQQ